MSVFDGHQSPSPRKRAPVRFQSDFWAVLLTEGVLGGTASRSNSSGGIQVSLARIDVKRIRRNPYARAASGVRSAENADHASEDPHRQRCGNGDSLHCVQFPPDSRRRTVTKPDGVRGAAELRTSVARKGPPDRRGTFCRSPRRRPLAHAASQLRKRARHLDSSHVSRVS